MPQTALQIARFGSKDIFHTIIFPKNKQDIDSNKVYLSGVYFPHLSMQQEKITSEGQAWRHS